MAVPAWIWIFFTFAFGSCVGSFLNVVIYRLPREKSLVTPPSSCPSCNKHIRFYDNIPILSWLILIGKCRNCKAKISPRYFIIELLTGLTFLGAYYLFFESGLRGGVPGFFQGGWLLYLIMVVLLSGLIASSGIDLELWIIPLSICWFVTALGIIASGVGPLVMERSAITGYYLLPSTKLLNVREITIVSLSLGATAGLIISLILLKLGIIKQSYYVPEGTKDENELQYNDRREMLLEVLFLLPIIGLAIGAYMLCRLPKVNSFYLDIAQYSWAAGVLGSIFGYFVGCAIVWGTRILGTFAFGKEAMGLGDVHLMGAAGAIIGPLPIAAAFFIAPFFGLSWAISQMFFKKTRQIPYGPFLSLGIVSCIIINDRIYDYFIELLGMKY